MLCSIIGLLYEFVEKFMIFKLSIKQAVLCRYLEIIYEDISYKYILENLRSIKKIVSQIGQSKVYHSLQKYSSPYKILQC